LKKIAFYLMLKMLEGMPKHTRRRATKAGRAERRMNMVYFKDHDDAVRYAKKWYKGTCTIWFNRKMKMYYIVSI